MSKMKEKLTPEILSEYYMNKFPIDSLFSYIDAKNLSKREFGFVVKDNIFVRNISFDNKKQFREYMVKNSVNHAYVGAVYEVPPSKINPIQKIKWSYREFIFDLDIDEYDLVRSCGCKGDEYCRDCWSLVQDAVLFIDETMKEDFGFSQIKWFFSGRRGVHGWVIDDLAKTFDQAQRVSILYYLTFIHDEKRSQSIEDIPNEAKPLRDRIYSMVAKSYFDRATVDSLLKLKFKKKDAENIIASVEDTTNFDHHRYSNIIPLGEGRDNLSFIAANMMLQQNLK